MGSMSCLPALIGVALLIALIVARARLWITLLSTSIAIALLSHGLKGVESLFLSIDRVTVDVVTLSFLVALFVEVYRGVGGVERVGEELVKLLRKPIAIVTTVPAVLGLLPVAGGALMSAPIVDRVGDLLGLDRARKLFVNVWYRHVIFLAYPLSTSLIIASLLSNVSIWSLVVRQLPIAGAMALIGILIAFPRRTRGTSVVEGKVDLLQLLRSFAPMLVAIAISLALSKYLDYELPIPLGRASMLIGISMGIVLALAFLSRSRVLDLVNALKSRTVVELVLAAYGAMLLRKAFTEAGIQALATQMTSAVPPTIIIVAVPTLFALITGSPMNGVALSFPIIESVTNLNAATASLAYVSAFLGYVGSPLHLCYVYTAQYLGIDYVEGYRYMVPAIAMSYAIAIVLYVVMH